VVADLRAVVESVAVRIVLKRIRLVVVHLRSVREPVTVRIRDGRVGPASLFRAVVESVTVGVVVERAVPSRSSTSIGSPSPSGSTTVAPATTPVVSDPTRRTRTVSSREDRIS